MNINNILSLWATNLKHMRDLFRFVKIERKTARTLWLKTFWNYPASFFSLIPVLIIALSNCLLWLIYQVCAVISFGVFMIPCMLFGYVPVAQVHIEHGEDEDEDEGMMTAEEMEVVLNDLESRLKARLREIQGQKDDES